MASSRRYKIFRARENRKGDIRLHCRLRSRFCEADHAVWECPPEMKIYSTDSLPQSLTHGLSRMFEVYTSGRIYSAMLSPPQGRGRPSHLWYVALTTAVRGSGQVEQSPKPVVFLHEDRAARQCLVYLFSRPQLPSFPLHTHTYIFIRNSVWTGE